MLQKSLVRIVLLEWRLLFATWTPLLPFASRKTQKTKVYASLRAQLALAVKIQETQREKAAQLVQLTWQKDYLHPLAKVAKQTCKQASVKWADKETQDTAEAAQNGNCSSVWDFGKKA